MPDARVLGRQEPDQRQQQQARVQLLAAVGLDEGAELGVEALRADLAVDPLAQRAPAVDRALEPELLDRADRAVEGDPGHDLGVGEVASAAAHLPDALVRLVPDLLEVLDQRRCSPQPASLGASPMRRAW